MPLFDYRCDCGATFEKYVTTAAAENPPCPRCAASTHRLISRVALLGRAAPPPSDLGAPTSYEGTFNGDREYIAHWQRQIETRRKFEEKHPEHSTKRDAVAAHEGAFESKPLTYRELASRAGASGDATAAVAEASKERGAKPVRVGHKGQ